MHHKELDFQRYSRRDFLRFAILGGTALAVEACVPIKRKSVPTQPENLTAQDILIRIKDRYGVLIPTQIETTYSNDSNEGNTSPNNHVPSIEEAQVIEDAISRIPAAGFLSPLVIPFVNISEGAIAGGSFMGRDWPFFLHRQNYTGLPTDRFLDDKPAIKLLIPLAGLDASLPIKTEDTSNLPPISQITLNTVRVRLNLQETVPWTNGRERLKQTVVHEYFHALDDKVSIANSPSISEYRKRQGFYIWNKNTNDITNPLYVTFAKVTGWRLVSLIDYIAQYDPEVAKRRSKEHPESEKTFIWDMDHAIWGDLAHRHGGPTIYSRYGPIQESIAEYWMTSVLYPGLLTADERQYFDNIKNGLKGDPQKFVQEIVKNPNILLKGITK